MSQTEKNQRTLKTSVQMSLCLLQISGGYERDIKLQTFKPQFIHYSKYSHFKLQGPFG